MQQSALSTLFSQISLTCGHDEVEYCQGQATCTLLLCKLNNSFQENHYHIHDLAYLMDQLSSYVLHANCIIEDNILKSWLYTCIVGKSSVKCDLNLERRNQKTCKHDYMIFSWTCGPVVLGQKKYSEKGRAQRFWFSNSFSCIFDFHCFGIVLG